MDRKVQKKALRVALTAARGAGLIALKHYKRLKKISLKEGAGLVSEADLQSEKFIIKCIRKVFPQHQFLGEEGGYTGEAGAQALWVVDPLDGTTNYVHGFPFFCTSIGLEMDGCLQVGVVHAPLLKYTFTAMKGRGAFLNGKKIKVSKTDTVEDSLLATGFSYKKADTLELELRDFKSLANAARGIRRAGSAALDMCMVAWGVFDGFWERELSPWDTAAGTLIIREAGGIVTDFTGAPYHSSMKSVLAGNPQIHPLILNCVKP